MDLLVLNIGNTHTQVAPCRGRLLGPLRRLATAELCADAARALPEAAPGLPLVAACVVPAAAARLRAALAACPLCLIDAAHVQELDVRRVASSLGADRLANAVAALDLTSPPYIVLDCGTAITLTAVDAQRCVRGGAILPGRRLQRRALHEHTAQLPEADLAPGLPEAIGDSTVAAIRAGIDLGLVGAVRLLLERTAAELGAAPCPVLAAGGDAAHFAAALPDLRLAPPDFTLRGALRIGAPFAAAAGNAPAAGRPPAAGGSSPS